MRDNLNSGERCHVCKEERTETYAEIAPGRHVYVCEKCLEKAKENFIWICMHCGKVYVKPKSVVLRRLADPGLWRAYLQCKDLQIIQGIARCIDCDREAITEFFSGARGAQRRGAC
jgi:hypothetical protein